DKRKTETGINRRKPDIISLDPFVKTHALEENDSGDMDFVCDLLARLAIEFNIAVDSPHHVHKGQIEPGNADAGRGASGIKDAGRLIFTLVAMSEKEAEDFNIDPADRGAYIRLDPGKTNIAQRAGKAIWFKIDARNIGNGTAEYPNGDNVQVVKPWTPPDTWAGLQVHTLNAVLSAIQGGIIGENGPTGQRYSSAPSATERAAWSPPVRGP